MRKYTAQRELSEFGEYYNYDVSYMQHMLDTSPEAYFKFEPMAILARHREAAPKPAFYAAKLVGALTEDCGPCVQLVVDMAREAGMSEKCIAAVLRRDLSAMDPETALGFRFADAIVRRAPEAEDARELVREQWGEVAVIDLTLGTQIGRVFPMIKTGLGHGQSCQRVRVGEHPVEVVKEAA